MRTHIGQYQIETPLGRGGMGVVYRGVHAHLGRPVAIKELAPELTQQPEFKERFFSEAKTQARLQHPNIVGVYDLLEDNGDFFIVMELVVGEPLDEILRARDRRGMDLGETSAIFDQILAALDYAHSEGVIHRDIKPSNVMVTAGGRVKLTDFGIALLIGDKRLTASQSAIGTPAYMSPEQILRPRSIDHRTDIYSAAVVFFEMIAGVPPFDSDSEYMIKKLHVETPPDLAKISTLVPAPVVAAIATALAKEPEARFATAGLFQRALHEAASFAIPAAAAPLPPPVYRPTVPDVPPATGGVRPPVPSPVPIAPSTGVGLPPAPVAPASSSWLSGPRLIALTAAAVIILGLGFVFLFLNLNRGAAETVAAQTPTPAAAAPIQQAALTDTSSAPLPADSVQPAAAPLEPAASGSTASTTAPAAPPPQQTAPPAERPRTEKPVSRAQETKAEPPPPPPPAETSKPVEEPPQEAAAPAPAPAPAQAGASSGTALGQLQAMEDVVMSVERFAKQTSEAYADSDSDGEMGEMLEKFAESAEKVRKEFRAASGTGIGGLKSKLLRFGKGGQQADTKVLEGKAKELIRQGDVIDRAVKSDPLPPAAQQFWSDTRGQLRRLGQFFP